MLHWLIGKGYVRSEGIVAIFIQRHTVARRVYATVVHAKSNTDGYKQAGTNINSTYFVNKHSKTVVVDA